MSDKNKKVFKLYMWGIVLILVIIFTIYLNSKSLIKTNQEEAKNTEEDFIIIYDGSENNPYIEGVQ